MQMNEIIISFNASVARYGCDGRLLFHHEMALILTMMRT